jgi:hypothetical protein
MTLSCYGERGQTHFVTGHSLSGGQKEALTTAISTQRHKYLAASSVIDVSPPPRTQFSLPSSDILSRLAAVEREDLPVYTARTQNAFLYRQMAFSLPHLRCTVIREIGHNQRP